jgi:hypothetical protein
MEKQKSLKSWLSNCLPLSTVSSDGTPNRLIMFCEKNFWAVFDVIVDTALASIHLVKYSTAMKVNLRFPWAVGSGPPGGPPQRLAGFARPRDSIRDADYSGPVEALTDHLGSEGPR